MTFTLFDGDCLDVMANMPDNYFDSVVTDPPYELGFMGRAWDASGIAFCSNTWAEVLRVMKPGAHLVAFGAPKNYHRLACAIEDAGFEIRDSISYLYGTGPLLWTFGTGFPKSLNVSKALDDVRCRCCQENGEEVQPSHGKDLRDLRGSMEASEPLSSGEEFDVFAGMQRGEDFEKQDGEVYGGTDALRNVRGDDLSRSMPQSTVEEGLLQLLMPGEGPAGRETAGDSASRGKWADAGRSREKAGSISHGEQSGVEGRRDLQASEGELQGRDVCESAGMGEADVAQGRLYNATSASDGGNVRLPADAGRSGQSQGPQPIEQSSIKSGTVADKRGPQTRGSWPVCERCGKPRIPDGLGTALKPAAEFIVLARKPLSEKTVAANVLRWGTGALNIDATRIAHNEPIKTMKAQAAGDLVYGQAGRRAETTELKEAGRWPANLCHDGSQQVLDLFPHTAPSKSASGVKRHGRSGGIMGDVGALRDGRPEGHNDDGGSAARFFFSAKLNDEERGAVFGSEYENAASELEKIAREWDAGDKERLAYARWFASKLRAKANPENAAESHRFFYSAKASKADRAGSKHPTVKPVSLMQWLVRMVTPQGGKLLDPFAGSGTTGAAAHLEGCDAVLIERELEYLEDIKRRLSSLEAA